MAVKMVYFFFYFKVWEERTTFTEEVADLSNTFVNPLLLNKSVTIDMNICIVPLY